MAVYYKFKSAKDYHSIPMDAPFISVGTLKEKIFESKHLGRGTDFDLVVSNAQTNEEYLDEAMLIPKNTSVLIRRVPGQPRLPIVAEPEKKDVEHKLMGMVPKNTTLPAEDTSVMKYPEDSDWDEFGNDLYTIPDALPVQSSNIILEAPPTNIADEESKIKALIDTPALDWQRQGSDFGAGRGFGRGIGGRMGGGRGFGLERKTPPQGYVCHRCKLPGHFIQHCPTNGDPNFDIKRVKQPTGIPRSMLMVNPQGSYALPNGSVAVLKPNEAAFEKEIEGLPSTRSVGDLPPELHCPLCNDVMKDAVLTSKCCFKSFCDKCIRDYIISKSMCVCGARNILADDLLPNKTLRDTINRILESGNSSADNAGSILQVQDVESARPQPKIPSPTTSAASKGELKVSPVNKGMTNNVQEPVDEIEVSAPPQISDQVMITKAADISEVAHNLMSVKEPASQGGGQPVEAEVWQKLAPIEAGKKKKKKKVQMPANDLQWKTPYGVGAENYMMPIGPPPGYNPYWNGMQPCMEGFMNPYTGPMQMMGYGLGPFDMPFAGGIPQDPFGFQGYMMPVPPHRDLAQPSMGRNIPPPIMSRDEFEARKTDLKRKHENERHSEREFSKNQDCVGDVSSMKSKIKSLPLPPGSNSHHPRGVELPRPSKGKSDHHHNDLDHRNRGRDHDGDRDRHHRLESSSRRSSEPIGKGGVFSRISSLEAKEEVTKKRKKVVSNGYNEEGRKSSSSMVDYESSDDDDRHFKRRRPSRHKSSPPPQSDYLRASRERKHR
ncbi:hypothetical protein PIB30_063508 [Stylosanthes scabra]|uniref:DWNN domain-containing protein n=1 Tax=Stylosanthes scabra TaxID=79078 RepID=A0ABU6TN18_9FABA|nr:hypothetical protein [Stylosanthes scabra]